METTYQKLFAISLVLCLVASIQVQTAPVSYGAGLIQRAKRSLLWRWNTLRPVGASCRDHAECGTKYCREQTCSFRVFSS
ncbi:liver-expressed antimicrobial peptide 2 [Scleropages formosus]|uniref:liver-expressed antimicrobial peptide 2 n=1 Tax=Scleropages formosus TaxID=113540 RepID=UPI0008787EA2|nr:liver-expressed antimicrobial peptide 2-like [Scleropages formosus]